MRLTVTPAARPAHPLPCTRSGAPALCALAAGLALAFGATPASAQATLSTVTVNGKREPVYPVKRSSTATRTDTPLQDTPQSISVVTEDEVKDRAAQGLAEALRYVPGLGFAQGEGNRETPIFRGISTTGDFFVDGVRDDVQYYRDLYNIERVEVFRGPNAMIFGRGATGGLINRVSKTAQWTPSSGGSLTIGSQRNQRATIDLNRPINEELAVRVSALVEDSDSFRRGVHLKRTGINPTLSWRPAGHTLVTLGAEHFRDDRIADRGVPSFRGAPVVTERSTFFGNAEGSPTGTRLDAATALVEHELAGGALLRNRTRWSDQDKFYQNAYPGAVNAAGTEVSLSAYNNAMSRKSVFNQTDFVLPWTSGGWMHKILLGAEFGRQETANFRNTGFFPRNATSVNVPLGNPATTLPVTYRQAASDADNESTARIAAFYVQDQIELTRAFQIVAGLRHDSFKVDALNKRNGARFQTDDELVSPRLGLIYKPVDALSLYANVSVAHQPRAGDQLSSLAPSNAALAPEKFKNLEFGAKWDLNSKLAATAAVYRLDRSNVIVLDPSDPAGLRTMLSDGQRNQGLELGVSGFLSPAWSVAGGYGYTDARFLADTSATLRKGARVGQVPRHTLTLWNRYDVNETWGLGLGVLSRSAMFASNELIPTASTPIPNVVLPGYTRFDAALFYKLSEALRLQLNVENLLDKSYYLYANGNNNISPGSPRALRVSLTAKF